MSNMNELLTDLETLMCNEYARMSMAYGKTFHTHHEAIGVLLEEVDEVNTEAAVFNHCLAKCWVFIKQDIDPTEWLDAMKTAALHAAAEWIQIAACCYKAQQKNSI